MRSRYISRLQNKQKKELYKRTYVLFLASVILILAVVVFGLPLMIKVSLVLDSIKGTSEPVVVNDQSVALPPRFVPTFEATNSAEISIDGYANEGSTIELFVNNDRVGKVVVSKEGVFNFPDVKLSEGDNVISAIATGTNGKKSTEAEPLKILYKKDPPSLSVDNPKNGDTFSGENKDIVIKGKTDDNTKVYINERMAIVSDDGSFELRYTLSDGDNIIKAQAIDLAGNKKEVELKVRYNP